ncbi:Periplasmic protein TonB, links inner and outer membranes [Hahella chejuensis KCTC 2396]|uniref:Periplasmic protein TonB, links inner and outer membranes n=1 Tax=Hahella chejuensis (strain KCTC 2396) TaxID=349521 RepID=Q2S6Y2_HAHCH|nr:energy transducer TonB [Hahella chejuensis]ABC33592.1 Periplasmic protein TonB, links inner and outer membranes [Hahella chejuensis KCTC 2396]
MKRHIIGITVALCLHISLAAWLTSGVSTPAPAPIAAAPVSLVLSQMRIVEQQVEAKQAEAEPAPEVEEVVEAEQPVIEEPEPEVVQETPKPVETPPEPKPEVAKVEKPKEPKKPVKKQPEPKKIVEKVRKPQPTKKEEVAKVDPEPNKKLAENPIPSPDPHTDISTAPAIAEQPQLSSAQIVSIEQAYINALQLALEKNKRYPLSAKRRRQEGTSTVEFTIMKSGDIAEVRLLDSSGISRLDEAAVKALVTLAQFHPIPDELDRNHWKMSVPIRFQLN